MGSKLLDQAKEEKQRSKFEEARLILYGDSYSNYNVVQRRMKDVYTYYRLSSAELSQFMSRTGHSISSGTKEAYHWLKDSKFGTAVKVSASAVGAAGKLVGRTAVAGAKAAGHYLAEAGKKTYAAGKAFIKSAPVQNTAKKTAGFFKTTGGWIKDRAIQISSHFKQSALWKNMKKSGQKLDESKKQAAKRISESKVGKAVKSAFSSAKSKLVSKAKSIGGQIKAAGKKAAAGISFLAEHASNAYDYVKSKAVDSHYKSQRDKAITQEQIHEMLNQKRDPQAYAQKLKNLEKLRSIIRENPNYNFRVNKRTGWSEDIARNAERMEKGQHGDIEMHDMVDDKAVPHTSVHGMRDQLEDYEKKNNVRTMSFKELEQNKAEETQKKKDESVIRRHGLDPDNLPKDPADNMVVGSGAKSVNKIKAAGDFLNNKAADAQKVLKKAEEKEKKIGDDIKKTEKINKAVNTVSNIIGADGLKNLSDKVKEKTDKIDAFKDKVDKEKSIVSDAADMVGSASSLMKGEVTKENILKTTGNTTKFANDVLKKNNIDIPIDNISKSINNILDISSGKDKEKNLVSLADNCLTEFAKISEKIQGSSHLSNIFQLLHDDDVKAADRVGSTIEAYKDGDKLKILAEHFKNVQAGTELLKKTLDEYKVGHKILDQVAFLKPAEDVIKHLQEIKRLTKTNEKLNKLTPADLEKNLNDSFIKHNLKVVRNDLVNQNNDRIKMEVVNGVQDVIVSTAGIATGTTAVTKVVGKALKYVSPTQLYMHQLKKMTNHDLVLKDIFESKEVIDQIKADCKLSEKEIAKEIAQMTNNGSVKKYASLFRAEAALDIHVANYQAEKHNIENGATNLKKAGDLKSNTAKQLYKELGGDMNFDNIKGQSRMQTHNKKAAEKKEQKKQKENEDKLTKLKNSSGKKKSK